MIRGDVVQTFMKLEFSATFLMCVCELTLLSRLDIVEFSDANLSDLVK